MIYLALKNCLKTSMRVVCGGIAAIRLTFVKKREESGGKAFERLCGVYPFREVSVCADNLISPQYDLQIIVPAYNAEKYIEKCVMSIARQETEFSIRLVVVDDGSEDATGDILDGLLNKFENGSLENSGGLKSFQVIHSLNGGAAAARNKSLENISAGYIMFCDADDILLQAAVEKLMKAALSQGADIAEGSVEAVDEKGRVCDRFVHRNSELSPMELFGYSVGKVIKAELFKNVKYPEGYLFEDSIFKYCIYPFAGKCLGTEEIVYSYLRNFGGVTKKSFKSERSVSTYYLTAALWEYLGERTGKFSVDIRKQLLHQLAVNHGRTNLLGKGISKDGFFYMRECYLKFDGRGGCEGLPFLYRLLDKAVVKGDFKSFALLCRRELYL